MTATTLLTLNRIKADLSVSTDAYVDAGGDYLIDKGLIRDKFEFQKIINDKTDSGITRHFNWSIVGMDLIVYYFTNHKYQTLKEMVKEEGIYAD